MFRYTMVMSTIVGLLLYILITMDKRPIVSDVGLTIVAKEIILEGVYDYRYTLSTDEIQLPFGEARITDFYWESDKNYNVSDVIWIGARWGKHYEQNKE